MASIFISAANENHESIYSRVLPLIDGMNHECLIPSDNITTEDEWQEILRDGLEPANLFILVLSAAAVENRLIRREVQWAADHPNIPKLAVVVEHCDWSSLKGEIQDWPAVDLTESGIEALVSTINTLLSKENSPLRADQCESPGNSSVLQLVPLERPIDSVQFSAFVPPLANPGEGIVLEIFAHTASQKIEVERLVSSSTRTKRAGWKSGVRVNRNSEIAVSVSFPGWVVQNPQATIDWTGEIENAQFWVDVPQEATVGTHTGRAMVFVNGVQRCQFGIEIEVATGSSHDQLLPLRLNPRMITSVFASYASADRERALMYKMDAEIVGIDVFVDQPSLRSGEKFQQRIWKEIEQRDLFCLFWSKEASNSEWVEKEWQFALKLKGSDFIQPYPLADPRDVPPPKVLADCLHFDSVNRILWDNERRRRSETTPT